MNTRSPSVIVHLKICAILQTDGTIHPEFVIIQFIEFGSTCISYNTSKHACK